MRKLVLIFAFLAVSNPSIFAETVSLNHTKFSNLPYVGPGPLRLATTGAQGNQFLSQPAVPGLPWNLSSSAGSREVKIPTNTLVAMGDQHLAWVEFSPMNSTLQYCVLPSCDRSIAVPTNLRGILAMKSIGAFVFTIHKQITGTYLSQLELATGKLTTLETLPEDQFAYRFGQCTIDRLVLVDPSKLRYKVFIPGRQSPSSYWTDIRSDLADELRNRKPDYQVFGNAQVADMHIIAHWVSSGGKDVFLLAKGQKGVGQYAVEVDQQGRELNKLIFKWPDGKSTNYAYPDFDRVISAGEQIYFFSRQGREVVYGGLK